MKVQKHIVDDKPLVSGLVDYKLTTAQILTQLGSGGKIKHKKRGFLVWLSGSKLTSDKIDWVAALPSFIFNPDVEWDYDYEIN